jgi:exosortase/archaeosortase family protein
MPVDIQTGATILQAFVLQHLRRIWHLGVNGHPIISRSTATLSNGTLTCGVALAYLLNLVRLCGLVLCYRVALHYAPLAGHMAAADYVLGSILFFCAAVFVLALPRRWKRISNQPANS